MGKKLCNGHANDVRTAEHHGLLARCFNATALEKLDATGGSARKSEGRFATTKSHITNIVCGETICILLHLYGLEHQCLIDVLWKGKLDQDAVHLGVVVQFFDCSEKIFLRDSVGKLDVDGMEAYFCGSLLLHADIGGRIWARANENNGKTRSSLILFLQLFDFCLDFGTNVFGDRVAI
jgi:hypothetical protein